MPWEPIVSLYLCTAEQLERQAAQLEAEKNSNEISLLVKSVFWKLRAADLRRWAGSLVLLAEDPLPP